MSDRVAQSGMWLVAIDSAADSVFGEQVEAADLGCNPHKPGKIPIIPIWR